MLVIDSTQEPLDDDQIRIIRQLRLNLITRGTHGREMACVVAVAWAVIDLCDLALMGNWDARRRLTLLIRNNAATAPVDQLN